MAKTLDKLFEKYTGKFEKEFLRAINTEDEEAIHDLRVAIKKMRALFLFMEESKFARVKQDYPHLKKLKKIFQKAGQLREVHIHKNLYQHHRDQLGEDFPGFYKYLEQMEEHSRQEYHQSMPGLSFRRFYQQAEALQQALGGISKARLNRKLYTFVKSRVDACYRYMFEPRYEVHLHQIRKYLKHIRFIIGQKVGDVHKMVEDELSFEEIKKVEDMLGEWHDRDEFRKILEEYENTLDETGEEEKEILARYQQQVRQDIRKGVNHMRPELMHLFSLMKNLLEMNPQYS